MNMIDLIYIIGAFVLGITFLAWIEEGLRDYFEHIAKIDERDYERKNTL
jgi:hypothetical protein